MRRPWLVVCACVVGSTELARAATCPAPPGASAGVAAVDGRQRLLWIDARLDAEASRGRLWADAWAIGIGAAGVASLAVVPFVAPSERIDWYTSAASAAVGVVPLLVAPLAVTRDAPKVRAAVRATSFDDAAAVCATLADAETRLAESAADERWQRGWWMHAGNVAFNTGVLLFLGLGFHRWTSGLINGLSGVAVGEALILTQPTGAIDDAAAYDRGALPDRAADSPRTPAVGWVYGVTF